MIEKENKPFEDLPASFKSQIEPYLYRQTPLLEKELTNIWSMAIKSRNACPDKQELIAEWTVSAAVKSSLIHDNGAYEAIHAAFAALEFSPEDAGDAWDMLAAEITALEK